MVHSQLNFHQNRSDFPPHLMLVIMQPWEIKLQTVTFTWNSAHFSEFPPYININPEQAFIFPSENVRQWTNVIPMTNENKKLW